VYLFSLYNLHDVDRDSFTSFYLYGGILAASLNICGSIVSKMDVLWDYGSAA